MKEASEHRQAHRLTGTQSHLDDAEPGVDREQKEQPGEELVGSVNVREGLEEHVENGKKEQAPGIHQARRRIL